MGNIIFQWFRWHFIDASISILKAWRNFLLFGLNYFSIPLLLKTLFSPWHKYIWSYPRGFDIRKYFEVWTSNLVSRFVGASVRSFLIGVGICGEILIFIGGILVLVGWLILPLVSTFSLFFGIKLWLNSI